MMIGGAVLAGLVLIMSAGKGTVKMNSLPEYGFICVDTAKSGPEKYEKMKALAKIARFHYKNTISPGPRLYLYVEALGVFEVGVQLFHIYKRYQKVEHPLYMWRPWAIAINICGHPP